MNKKILMILIIILLLASMLRLWNLGNVPISPDWDEAALGYNAYSIMTTGRDEFGKFLPIVLRSFNDYKPALYAYLIIPFIQILDLTVLAVRLPSAIFGILSVLATFFLVKELFPNVTIGESSRRWVSDAFALIAACMLAISPWHIQFSRIAFESNVGLALNIFSILFFLKGFRKPLWLFFSVFCMSMSIYVYQSEKVFVPILATILVLIYRKQLLSLPRRHIVAVIIFGLILVSPMLVYMTTDKQAWARAQGVSIFSRVDNVEVDQVSKRIQRDMANNDYLGVIIDNRRTIFVKDTIDGYLSHFDLNWLFIKGDPNITRHHAPNMSLLYLWSFPFLLIGIYTLFFGRKENGISKQSKLLVFGWLLSVPIPASITYDIPHAVRTLNFLPTWDIFIAIGLLSTFIYLQIKLKPFIRYAVYGLIGLVMILNISYYLDQYFVQQNYYYALDWQYGHRQVTEYVKPIQEKYRKIIVSDRGEMSQSYIFFLFYLKYDPAQYLAGGGTRPDKLAFANFEFRPFRYDEEDRNVLLIGAPGDFPQIYKTVFEVNYPNKNLSMKVVEKE